MNTNGNPSPKPQDPLLSGEDKENLAIDPKRGPGRPAIKLTVEQSEALKKHSKKLEDDNKQLKLDLDDAQREMMERETLIMEQREEIATLSRQLLEATEENEELMKQLISSATPLTPKQPKPLIRGIVLVDSTTNGITENLPSSVQWEIVKSPIKDLDANLFAKFDIVLMCTGCDELIDGCSGIKLYDNLKNLISMIPSDTTTAIVSLPPLGMPHATQTNLFNYRLSKDKLPDHVTRISPDFNAGVKRSLLTPENNALSSLGIKMWTQAIQNDLPIPSSPKPLSGQPQPSTLAKSSASNCNITEIVTIPKEKIGNVIGRKGHTIRELSETFKVTMSIGKWMERFKGSTAEYVEKSDAVSISGNASQVRSAAVRVEQLTTNDSANVTVGLSEPVTKKFKF